MGVWKYKSFVHLGLNLKNKVESLFWFKVVHGGSRDAPGQWDRSTHHTHSTSTVGSVGDSNPRWRLVESFGSVGASRGVKWPRVVCGGASGVVPRSGVHGCFVGYTSFVGETLKTDVIWVMWE